MFNYAVEVLSVENSIFSDLHIKIKTHTITVAVRDETQSPIGVKLDLFKVKNPDALFVNESFVKLYCHWRKRKGLAPEVESLYKEFESNLNPSSLLLIGVF